MTINVWLEPTTSVIVGCKMYITEQAGHEKWKIKINRVKKDQFLGTNLYYYKQNPNSKITFKNIKN